MQDEINPLPAWVVLLTAGIIGFTALAFGAFIVRRNLVKAPSALLLCFPAGLLVGMSLLVVLPSALDELTVQCGWSTSNVLLLFLLGVFGMFLLEHVILVHEHACQPGEQMLLRPGAELSTASSSPAPAAPPAEVELGVPPSLLCAPCDEEPSPQVAVTTSEPALLEVCECCPANNNGDELSFLPFARTKKLGGKLSGNRHRSSRTSTGRAPTAAGAADAAIADAASACLCLVGQSTRLL